MGQVLQFKCPEPAATETLTCPAICLGCGYEWQAVAPVASEVNALECGHCGSFKGILTQFVRRTNHPNFTCLNCNGVLWSILKQRDTVKCCCANCGKLFPLVEAFDGVEK